MNRKLRSSLTLATKQGVFELPLRVEDPISKSLYIEREFEHSLVQDAMALAPRITGIPTGRGTVLDIGANNGVISIDMLVNRQVERAICVEPDPENFRRLQKNIQLNDLTTKAACVNCAVSNTDSILQFEISDSNYGDHRVRASTSDNDATELFAESNRSVISVTAKTIDSLLSAVEPAFSREIAVIWIDVQGHEGFIFAAGGKALTSGVPVVCEIWPYGILRAGMSREEYCQIVGRLWSHYWVRRRNGYVKYPIEIFDTYFEELGSGGDAFDNVIFTN